MSALELLQRVFHLVSQGARDAGMPVYLVGGAVRDILLHRETLEDLDFNVEGDAIVCARKIESIFPARLTAHNRFGTATLSAVASLPEAVTLDFVSARHESYPEPGALPVVAWGSLREDLARRDFSINTLALPLKAALTTASEARDIAHLAALWRSQLLDYCGGLADLDARVVRILHPRSFIDDPTRIFRAARYLERTSGSLSDETEEALRTAVMAGVFTTIRAERIWRELRLVFTDDGFLTVGDLLEEWGVFSELSLAPFSPFCRAIRNQVTTLGCPALAPAVYLHAWEFYLLLQTAEHLWEQRAHTLGHGKKWLKRFNRLLTASKRGAYGEVDDALLFCLLVLDTPPDSKKQICAYLMHMNKAEGHS